MKVTGRLVFAVLKMTDLPVIKVHNGVLMLYLKEVCLTRAAYWDKNARESVDRLVRNRIFGRRDECLDIVGLTIEDLEKWMND